MNDLMSQLDPATWSDVESIRAIFRQRRQSFEPELRDLARRALEESPDESLRIDAVNLLASAAVVSGDDDEGSRLFRLALEDTWGTGSHAERVACVNLAMILSRQRRLFEAFAISRRACRLAFASGDPLAICLAHAQLAKMLLELGDMPGFERAVEAAESSRPEIDENVAGWVPHLLAGLRAEVAIQHGDLDAAQEAVDEALDGPDVIREVVDMMRATHLRRVGRPDEALVVLRVALDAGTDESSYRIRFQAEELLCLVDLGDVAAARERAADCLAEMVRLGARCGSPTWRMRVGETVGMALAREEGTRGEARRALEIAAVAALERSWESKLFFQEFPQLARMEPEDVAVLEAHGERFAEKHRELLGAIRALLLEGARFETPIAECASDELFVAVCAWCNSLRGPERVWIPLDEFAQPTPDLEVTHGICHSCTAAMAAHGGGVPGAPRRRAEASEVA